MNLRSKHVIRRYSWIKGQQAVRAGASKPWLMCQIWPAQITALSSVQWQQSLTFSPIVTICYTRSSQSLEPGSCLIWGRHAVKAAAQHGTLQPLSTANSGCRVERLGFAAAMPGMIILAYYRLWFGNCWLEHGRYIVGGPDPLKNC